MRPERLLFVGDSLVEYFDWQSRFPQYEVKNHGIAGETVDGLLHRTEQIIEQAGQPDWVLIMCGTNNIVMEDYCVIPAYEKIINNFLNGFSNALLVINSFMPINMPWLSQTAIPRLNSSLENLSRKTGTDFLNIFDIFVKEQAERKNSLFLPDGVHLSETGYMIWSSAVADRIKSTF